jgi:hypothetical protein
MIQIFYNWSDGSGYLACPFCGQNWFVPFGIVGRPNVIDPPPQALIHQHHDAHPPDNQSLLTCDNASSWTSMPWQLIRVDDQALLRSGTVTVNANGTIAVSTA